MNFLWVVLGGAVGAMGRYAISLIPAKITFPFLTLLIYNRGSFSAAGSWHCWQGEP